MVSSPSHPRRGFPHPYVRRLMLSLHTKLPVGFVLDPFRPLQGEQAMTRNAPPHGSVDGMLSYRYKICPPEFTLRECQRDDTGYCPGIIYVSLLGKFYSVGAFYPVRAVEVDLDSNRIGVTFRHDEDWCTVEDISEASEGECGVPDETWDDGKLEAHDYEDDDNPVCWVERIAEDIGIPDPDVTQPEIGATVERD